MRYTLTALAVVIAASIGFIAVARDARSVSDEPGAPVDFAGRWKLAEQETRARGGKGSLGNHEEPVMIVRAGDRLVIKVESTDPAGRFEYDLTGQPLQAVTPAGKSMVTTSRWQGSTLVTKGKRLFTSSSGPVIHGFEERRSLSPDGHRMIVETRIHLFLEDVYRTSVYTRM